jgi:hypothetical protein
MSRGAYSQATCPDNTLAASAEGDGPEAAAEQIFSNYSWFIALHDGLDEARPLSRIERISENY